MVSTPLKNISQLGWLFPKYGKMFQTTNQYYIYDGGSTMVGHWGGKMAGETTGLDQAFSENLTRTMAGKFHATPGSTGKHLTCCNHQRWERKHQSWEDPPQIMTNPLDFGWCFQSLKNISVVDRYLSIIFNCIPIPIIYYNYINMIQYGLSSRNHNIQWLIKPGHLQLQLLSRFCKAPCAFSPLLKLAHGDSAKMSWKLRNGEAVPLKLGWFLFSYFLEGWENSFFFGN